jgi:hypothetical protein
MILVTNQPRDTAFWLRFHFEVEMGTTQSLYIIKAPPYSKPQPDKCRPFPVDALHHLRLSV